MPPRRFAFALLIILNLFIAPLYAGAFLLALVLAVLPLFPSRVAIANVRRQLNYGPFHARFFSACVYFQYFIYLVEALVIWPLGLTQVVNKQDFAAFIKQLQHGYPHLPSGGIVLLSAHFGNIEVAGQAVAEVFESNLNSSYYALAKPSSLAWMTSFLNWYRGKRRIQLLWTDRKDLLRAMLECLKKGNGLGFLCDQKPAAGGLFVRFFKDFCAFPVAGIDVGVRAGLPIVHIVSRRKFPGVFELVFAEGSNSHIDSQKEAVAHSAKLSGNSSVRNAELFPIFRTAKEQRVAEILSAFAGWLEDVVSHRPTQWSWDYKKWSRKPELIEQ